MPRLIFALVMSLHGLIHLLGFVKAWNIAPVEQLSGTTLVPLSEGLTKSVGVLWLAAFIGFSTAVAAFFFKREWWWVVGLCALVLSQVLVVLYWKDAWAGTIANLIILPVLVVSAASSSFTTGVETEVRALLASAIAPDREVLTPEKVEGLPSCVKRWLHRSGAVGKMLIHTARLKQHGSMRTSPNGSWMEFEAEQYVTVEKPGFIWTTAVQVAPLLYLAGRDRYEDGRAHMLIKFLSLIPVADSRGRETDQGSLVRYLAEMIWYPSSVVSSYVRWEEIDSASARATMSYGGIAASGVFRFNADGDVTAFEAQRYREVDRKFSMETWSIAMKDCREFNGITVPSVSEVAWKLPVGDFTWLRLEVTDLEYNRRDLCPRQSGHFPP